MLFAETDYFPKKASKWRFSNARMNSATIFLENNGSAQYTYKAKNGMILPEGIKIVTALSKWIADVKITLDIQMHDGSKQHCTGKIIKDLNSNYSEVIFIVDSAAFDNVVISYAAANATNIVSFKLFFSLTDEAYNTDIVDTLRGLRRVLFDRNTFPVTVTTEEETICTITFRLTKDTRIPSHILINVEASAECVIEIRVVDALVSNATFPARFSLVQGSNAIGIPKSFLDIKAGLHNLALSVRLVPQVLLPQVTIQTFRALYTIDSGYIASRVRDIGADVRDAALQSPYVEDEPQKIFAISIDGTEARMSSTYYAEDEPQDWVGEYTVTDNAVEAAVEFYGTWDEAEDVDGYVFVTDLQPWAFWVDASGNLKARYGPIPAAPLPDTAVILDTGVSKIAACTGFASVYRPEDDQGLIIAYVKSGRAYYRAYCMHQNLTVYWDSITELVALGTDVVEIKVSRTNDYRVMFMATLSTGETKIIISTRNYVGQAFKAEKAYIKASGGIFSFDQITYWNTDFADTVTAKVYGSFCYGVANSDSFNMPVCIDLEATEYTIIATYDCDIFHLELPEVLPKCTFAPIAGTVSISRIASNKICYTFSEPVVVSRGLQITFSNCYEAGYNVSGYTYFMYSTWMALPIKPYVMSDTVTLYTNGIFACLPIVFTTVYTTDNVTIKASGIQLTLQPLGSLPI